jgi:polygalacturonase
VDERLFRAQPRPRRRTATPALSERLSNSGVSDQRGGDSPKRSRFRPPSAGGRVGRLVLTFALSGIGCSSRVSAPPATTASGLDVTTMGARADDSVDDTAALQRAIDVALALDQPVHIPAGTYLVSAPLRYDTGLVLTGDGMANSTLENTTSRANGTAMLIPEHPGVKHVRLSAFSLDQRADWYDRDGESRDEPLVDVTGTVGLVIDGVGFHNVRTIAVYSDASRDQPTIGLRLLRNHVFESNGGGFSLFGASGDVSISENVLERTKDDAIAIQDHRVGDYPSGIVVKNNIVRNCTLRTAFGSTPNGILVFGADDVTVDGNSIHKVLSNGIRVGSGANRRGKALRVTNNSISGAGTHNDSTDVPAYGIFVIGADHVLVAGNRVNNSKHRDYLAQDSTDVRGP